MSAGEPDRALDLLNHRRDDALGTRQDEETVRHADAATMRIVRRLRLRTHNSLLQRLAVDPYRRPADYRRAEYAEYEAWRTMGLLGEQVGFRPQEVDSPAEWHAWWQAFSLGTDGTFPPGTEPEYHADIQADLAEFRQLGNASPPRMPYAFDRWLAQTTPPDPAARSPQPYRDVRAALRAAALAGQPFTPRDGVPPRLLAELAFEEAELTALRLPKVAVRLFTTAASAYDEAGDRIGSLLARVSASRADTGAILTAALNATPAHSLLARQNPVLAAKLAGPPEDACPWQHWAAQLRGLPATGLAASARDGDPRSPQLPRSGTGPSQLTIPVITPSPRYGAQDSGSKRRARAWILAAGLVLMSLGVAVTVALLPAGGTQSRTGIPPRPRRCPRHPPRLRRRP